MLTVKQLKQRKIFDISLSESRIYRKWQISTIIREISDSNLETGRNGSKFRVSRFIRESWHACVQPWKREKKYWSQSRQSWQQLTDFHLTLPDFTLFLGVARFQTPSAVHIFKFGAGHICLEGFKRLVTPLGKSENVRHGLLIF